ncbi:MAG: M20/M25/M40 family metallo-hydrolase [Gemmatimonadota bacterium]|nr:M20/M25/M40 family metallo-hydrolase [Gemmatimonadota bacterium]
MLKKLAFRTSFALAASHFLPVNAPLLQAQMPNVAPYRATATKIIAAATSDSVPWNRVAYIADMFGHRISGSAALESTIDWIVAEMKKDGLENVHTEPVMVPHWVRGAESAELVEPRRVGLAMLGLGGSVGTPAGGITAEVLVVTSFDDLKARAAQARGKIVVFDVPFSTATTDPFREYSRVVAYRGGGATAAAKLGAVAALVRSVTPNSIRSPHTGALRYDTTVAKIPSAAISVEDAMMLHRMQERGTKTVVHLSMAAQTLPDTPSRNIIAEIKGSEKPDEVVAFGGHIDSWDVGTGSMDDAGGAFAAWGALRAMHKLGLRARRTMRVVLWTNEENGDRGGIAYATQHEAELAKHVLVIESDEGAFAPVGFAVNDEAMDTTTSRKAQAMTRTIAELLRPIGATRVTGGGGDSDIEPSVQKGVPGLSLDTDPRKYFWYHHTQADTPDKLDPADVSKCSAALAVMAYVTADMPQLFPRGNVSPRPRR